MRGTIIGVLRGGPSKEHEVSLRTGHAIAASLPKEHYTVRDIYIDKEGVWHERGVPTTPAKALRSIDMVFVGLHGEYGEDGEVQKILERSGVPFTGSDSFSSYIASHKVLSKERAKSAGLLTPKYHLIEEGSDVEQGLAHVVRTFSQPVVVKPVKWGSSVGISIVGGYAPLHKAVVELLDQNSGGVLIEEYIKGIDATAGVIANMRSEELYGLPVVEIVPNDEFLTFAAKYSGASRETCPAKFPKKVSDELLRQAKVMHEELGLKQYSRSDFIVSPKGIYYLETNNLPALTPDTVFGRSAEAVGIKFPDLVEHFVSQVRA